MLDAIALEGAVFEPEEVDVLTMALNLAKKKLDDTIQANSTEASELARLVHNLGRSRLRLKKKLRTALDAASLAEEAVDLMVYLREQNQNVLADELKSNVIPSREIPIFPAEVRLVPTTILKAGKEQVRA